MKLRSGKLTLSIEEQLQQKIDEWIEQGDVTQLLDLSKLRLTTIPEGILPSTLQWLDCSRNKLTILPTLPTTLQRLNCVHNKLTNLPTIPTTLQRLNCAFNKLVNIPTLPPTLDDLECSHNKLTSLPELPSTLQKLYCSYNKLTSLPNLPPILKTLYCSDNKLVSLPSLPPILKTLFCMNNELISLINATDIIPPTLNILYCWDNPVYLAFPPLGCMMHNKSPQNYLEYLQRTQFEKPVGQPVEEPIQVTDLTFQASKIPSTNTQQKSATRWERFRRSCVKVFSVC